MIIYVDEPILKHGWCHMMVDKGADLQDLHDFAESIGLRLEWFQDGKRSPHYDLSISKRKLAIKKGAFAIRNKDLIDLYVL